MPVLHVANVAETDLPEKDYVVRDGDIMLFRFNV